MEHLGILIWLIFSQTSFSETREVGILRHPCERIVMLLGKPEIETIILPNKLDSPVEFSLFCFYQDSATGGGWGCTSLPWWWPQFSVAQINYCELRPVWKKKVNVPLTRWAAGWIQHTNILFGVVFWYGEVDHCTNLAPPFFSLVVEEEIPRVTIEIEGAPGIPSDWVKCFWKSFAQFSIGNAHQHCFCYLVRPFCFGFEQPPNGGGWFFRPCCFTVVSDFPWLSPNCPSACNAHGQSVRRPFWIVGLKCCRFRMFHHHGNGAMIPTNCSDGELRSRFQMLNRTLVLACFCSMVFPTFLNDGWSWINYNDLTRQRHWNVTECSFL